MGSVALVMARPRFVAVKSTSADGFVLILPVSGQKVKGISPSPFEVLIRSGEQEPAGTSNRAAITTGLRHDLNT